MSSAAKANNSSFSIVSQVVRQPQAASVAASGNNNSGNNLVSNQNPSVINNGNNNSTASVIASSTASFDQSSRAPSPIPATQDDDDNEPMVIGANPNTSYYEKYFLVNKRKHELQFQIKRALELVKGRFSYQRLNGLAQVSDILHKMALATSTKYSADGSANEREIFNLIHMDMNQEMNSTLPQCSTN